MGKQTTRYDIKRIRLDLQNDCGAAIFAGFDSAFDELQILDQATDEEVVEIAKKKKKNMSDYYIS